MRNTILVNTILLLLNANLVFSQTDFYSKSVNIPLPPTGGFTRIVNLSTLPATIPNDSATVIIKWNKCASLVYAHLDLFTYRGYTVPFGQLFPPVPSSCNLIDTVKISPLEIDNVLNYNQQHGMRNLTFQIHAINYNTSCTCLQLNTWLIDEFEVSFSQMKAEFTADTTEACEGDAIMFHDANHHPSVQRLWRFPGGIPALSTDSNPTVIYPVAGFYPVTLIVTNPYGTDSIISNNLIHIIEGGPVNAGPDQTICAGDTIQLQASSVGTSYVWLSDTTLINPFSLNPSVHPTSSNSYVIMSAGPLTCRFMDTVNVDVLPITVPTIQVNGTTLTTQAFQSFQWYLNGIVIPGAVVQNYQANISGNYSVAVTDSNGCDAMSEPTYLTLTGIEEENISEKSLLISHNENQLTINSIDFSMKSISLFAVTGQEILSVRSVDGTSHFSIETSSLDSGIYILKAIGIDGSLLTAKFHL